MRALPLVVVAFGCKADPIVEEQPPSPKPPEISVKLASTRLGSDCGMGGVPKAPPATEVKQKKPERNRKPPIDAHPPQEPPGVRIPCDQTAVQFSVRAPATAQRTKLTLKKVELLDNNGVWLETLTAASPSKWGTDNFVDWDETIAPGQTLAVGYKLTQPDWSKIKNANQRSFKMRVVVLVGGEERTMEATAELRIEDTSNVVT